MSGISSIPVHGGRAALACAALAGVLLLGPVLGCERHDASKPGDEEQPPAVETQAAPAVQIEPAPRPIGPLAEGVSCMTAECHASYAAAPFSHVAVNASDCFVCHEQDVGGHVYPLKREGSELCTDCHAVSGKRSHQHDALQAPGCIACHDPHVGQTQFLLTAASTRELCLGCHVMPQGEHPHGPYAAGECTACHEPHESNFDHLLRGGEGAEHCFMCHEETRLALDRAPHVHAPAQQACTNCHDPHTSDAPHALQMPLDELCFSCHENVRQTLASAAVPHAAVFTGAGCVNCHDGHASGTDHLLLAREDELCLACHDEPVTTTTGRLVPDMTPVLRDKEFLHGPIRSGECSPCHTAHGSQFGRLLGSEYTSEFYQSFELGSYALCFDCHASEIVLTEETSTLTDFRDGDRNLHYVHVHDDRKGRTCRACHSIHGSDQPKHLAEAVPFEGSQWMLPIRFKQTPEGGSCAPGCHAPMSYSRDEFAPDSSAPTGGAP